jgi:hypothetical protein
MYDHLKYSDKYGTWSSICRRLGVDRSQANRCIDLYRIISCDPRLLICGLSFEFINTFYRRLNDVLQKDEQLALRLKQDLRKTAVCGNQLIFTHRVLPGGKEEPAALLSEGADWNPGWEFIAEKTDDEASDETEDELY